MSIGLVNGLQNGDGTSVVNTFWVDFSEQSTIVGWGSFTTKNIRYKIVGKIVFVMFDIRGTSNATTTSFTLPIQTSSIGISQINAFTYVANNGAPAIGLIYTTNTNTSLIQIARDSSNSPWTASGNKQIQGQFFYEIQ